MREYDKFVFTQLCLVSGQTNQASELISTFIGNRTFQSRIWFETTNYNKYFVIAKYIQTVKVGNLMHGDLDDTRGLIITTG